MPELKNVTDMAVIGKSAMTKLDNFLHFPPKDTTGLKLDRKNSPT